jgi:alanine racemase
VIRPTFARIDLEALQANHEAIRAFVVARSQPAPPPDLIAVIKANAYGHGAPRVGLALEAAGATMLACADIEEGVELRHAGVRIPILIFGALSVSDLDGVFAHDLTPTVASPFAARALQWAAAERGRRLHCHLKIDTGMNRLGFRFDNVAITIPPLLASPNLVIDAVATHFATADDLTHPLFDRQRERFERVLRELGDLGLQVSRRHAANSGALLRDRRVWYELVRPGLLLYGLAPSTLPCPIRLRPAMTLQSRITAVKGLRPGETVGYGARFTATRPSSVAVVPAGYADGLDVRLAGRGCVLVRGRRAPVIGSVCMDMMMIDVTGLDAAPGDEVVILGAQGDESIDAGEMAATIGTVPHEILCRTGSRISRLYGPSTLPPGQPCTQHPGHGPI